MTATAGHSRCDSSAHPSSRTAAEIACRYHSRQQSPGDGCCTHCNCLTTQDSERDWKGWIKEYQEERYQQRKKHYVDGRNVTVPVKHHQLMTTSQGQMVRLCTTHGNIIVRDIAAHSSTPDCQSCLSQPIDDQGFFSVCPRCFKGKLLA